MGSGHFAHVKLHKRSDGLLIAAKELKTPHLDLSREIAFYRSLTGSDDYKHIVRFYDASTTMSYGTLNYWRLSMEYCEGGTLEKVIMNHIKRQEPILESTIIQWGLQMCEALKVIESKGFVHRGECKCGCVQIHLIDAMQS